MADDTAGSQGRGPVGSPRLPYGPAIFDAIAGGDLQRMKAVGEAARKALYEVEFDRVPADRVAEVEEALNALTQVLARLEGRGQAESG